MNASLEGDVRLSNLVALRQLRLRKAELACRQAANLLADETRCREQAGDELAAAQTEALERQRQTQRRSEAGGISAEALVGALGHCERARVHIRECETRVEARIAAVQMASGGVRSAEQAVHKAQHKLESMREVFLEAIAAQGRTAEILIEDDNEELATQRYGSFGVSGC